MSAIRYKVYISYSCIENVFRPLTVVTFEPTSSLLAFVLPASFKKGDVTFFSRATGEDVRVPITPGNRPRLVVSTSQLSKGLWRALLQWSDGQKQYQDEKEILIV